MGVAVVNLPRTPDEYTRWVLEFPTTFVDEWKHQLTLCATEEQRKQLMRNLHDWIYYTSNAYPELVKLEPWHAKSTAGQPIANKYPSFRVFIVDVFIGNLHSRGTEPEMTDIHKYVTSVWLRTQTRWGK